MSYDDIVYTAAVLEKAARQTKNTISDLVKYTGLNYISHLAEYADVNHCLSLQQVADEIIEDNNIPTGKFDNVAECQYKVPSVVDIGKVYARLVVDSEPDEQNYTIALYNILVSQISEMISDFNASWYYASRSELAYEYSKLKAID